MSTPPTRTAAREQPLDSHQQAVWDERVQTWDEVCASPAFQALADRVEELAAVRADDVVVDLGCGTGLLARRLAAGARRVVAVDVSGEMLRRLDERAGQDGIRNVETVQADLRSLPLPDECATVVVSNYAFHHLDDASKELALSEARRVLVPGGRLVVCDMMFGLSLAPRDRQVVARKIVSLARRGPGGLWRIAKNGFRVATRRWEQPSPPEAWRRMLAARRFEAIEVEVLAHEGGLAVARRPLREGGATV